MLLAIEMILLALIIISGLSDAPTDVADCLPLLLLPEGVVLCSCLTRHFLRQQLRHSLVGFFRFLYFTLLP